MRWKCSLLTEEEHEELEDWIASLVVEKEELMRQPWKAGQEEGEDELLAENKYIQRCVTSTSVPAMH